MSGLWYVIRTKPQQERQAVAGLARQGFELFFPCVQKPRARGNSTTVPLFPGYLFLRFDGNTQEWPSLGMLPGALGWVRFNGVVPAIPDEVVAELVERVEAINSGGGLWTRFRRGETVRVVSGKVESLAQVVEDAKSPQARVRVLLEFMGRQVEAKVPWSTLRPVQDGSAAVDSYRRARRTRGAGRWIKGFGPRAVASA